MRGGEKFKGKTKTEAHVQRISEKYKRKIEEERKKYPKVISPLKRKKEEEDEKIRTFPPPRSYSVTKPSASKYDSWSRIDHQIASLSKYDPQLTGYSKFEHKGAGF